MKKYLRYTFLLPLFLCSFAATAQPQLNASTLTVPFGGNAYVTGKTGERGEEQVSVFFRVGQPGELCLSLRYNATDTVSISARCAGAAWRVKLNAGANAVAPLGCVKVSDSGYVRVDFQGLTLGELAKKRDQTSPTKQAGAEAIDLTATGSALAGTTSCVGDFSFYWGRRGPSVHLSYPFPEKETIEWFYSELTVPQGQDPVGSYYMANGFGEGYFGIQVNSATERRVLFSVWSPFKTDNPSEIPESHKIKLLAKGEKVRTGSFGNEGSGGQSSLIYPWKTGNTYKFLTRVEPDGNGATEYTAYFYTPDEQKWLLIASFLRPLTDTYYKRAHSFLENFVPTNGYLSRRASYANQWARTVDGRWLYVGSRAKFSIDDTGRKGARMDYKGGVQNGAFFLQNGGFFSDYTPAGAELHNPKNEKLTPPEIDLEKLRNLHEKLNNNH
ncbi:MAG: DUF3472 domain-containing protein [Prevotellaceae bacterium]|jgi:hypothetical protein|nr:DUF3472 domain-containing protein [Prevotellaceae bacterium]